MVNKTTLQEFKDRFNEIRKYDPDFTEADVNDGVFETGLVDYFKCKYDMDEKDINALFTLRIGYQGLRAIDKFIAGKCKYMDYYFIKVVKDLLVNPATSEILSFLYGDVVTRKLKKYIKKHKI